jgi:hypothetical protein
MDKQLFITCLKENFEYLDFWEKHMETLGRYSKDRGEQSPNEWPTNIVEKNKALDAFANGLLKFGVDIGTYQADADLFRMGFTILDPRHKEPPSKKIADILVPIEPAVMQVLSDDDLPNQECLSSCLLSEEGLPLKPSQRLLLVDLSRKKSEIRDDFNAFLDKVYDLRAHADQLLNDSWENHYAQWSPNTCRDRAEAWDQLKIWRMRKERIPFFEIAKGLGITADAAKKAFYRAYERTQGRRYDRERYLEYGQKLNPWDMTKTCQTCPDWRTCSELCPEMLRIADQGILKSTKEYLGEKDLLDDGGIADYRQHQTWEKNEKYWTR